MGRRVPAIRPQGAGHGRAADGWRDALGRVWLPVVAGRSEICICQILQTDSNANFRLPIPPHVPNLFFFFSFFAKLFFPFTVFKSVRIAENLLIRCVLVVISLVNVIFARGFNSFVVHVM